MKRSENDGAVYQQEGGKGGRKREVTESLFCVKEKKSLWGGLGEGGKGGKR